MKEMMDWALEMLPPLALVTGLMIVVGAGVQACNLSLHASIKISSADGGVAQK